MWNKPSNEQLAKIHAASEWPCHDQTPKNSTLILGFYLLQKEYSQNLIFQLA